MNGATSFPKIDVVCPTPPLNRPLSKSSRDCLTVVTLPINDEPSTSWHVADAKLIVLRSHPQVNVRAAIPQLIVESEKGAHALIPELAEGLHSSDPQVRDATVRALLKLVERHGPFREPVARIAREPHGATR